MEREALWAVPVWIEVREQDGHADLLVTANDYAFCCESGLRILVDDAVPWAPARPLFNQHSYHVTNILDDGRVPAREEPSWSRYNTFRVQGPPLIGPPVPAEAGGSRPHARWF